MSTVIHGTEFPERVMVNVTPEDIHNGKPGNPTSCPIALAVERALGLNPGHWTVDVGSNDDTIEVFSIYTADETDTLFYHVPEVNLEGIIEDFDEGWGMNPFQFEIRR